MCLKNYNFIKQYMTNKNNEKENLIKYLNDLYRTRKNNDSDLQSVMKALKKAHEKGTPFHNIHRKGIMDLLKKYLETPPSPIGFIIFKTGLNFNINNSPPPSPSPPKHKPKPKPKPRVLKNPRVKRRLFN